MLDAHTQAVLVVVFLACSANFLVARTYGPRWMRPWMLYAALVMLGWAGFYLAASINTFNRAGWLPILTDVARTLQFFNAFGFLAAGVLIAAPFWKRVLSSHSEGTEGAQRGGPS